MACAVPLYIPIIGINLITKTEQKLYIFVGNVNEEIKKILNKLENKKMIYENKKKKIKKIKL